jgi:hypothetical protein
VHIRGSIVACKVFVTGEDDARYENFLNIDSTLLVSSEKVIRMPDGLHILHESKVVGLCIEHGRCAFKPFMHGTESENAVSDGGLTVTKLHDLLTPKLRVEELCPVREGTVLEVIEGAVFHGVR